jgi:RNA polymerase sigma factor (TIGR02999 family)
LPELPSKTVSTLPANWFAGDDQTLRAAVPLVLDELRRTAHYYHDHHHHHHHLNHHHVRNERPDQTVQSTALVHEACLRLEKQGAAHFPNRAHFLALCGQLMRQILVEYARSGNAAKRDRGYRLALAENLAFHARSVDMVAPDDGLNELAKLDQKQSQIVELRFFGGRSIDETGDRLQLSPAAVKRHWATARLCRHHRMNKEQQ